MAEQKKIHIPVTGKEYPVRKSNTQPAKSLWKVPEQNRLLTKEGIRVFIENHIREYHEDMSKAGNKPTLSPSSRAREIIARTREMTLREVGEWLEEICNEHYPYPKRPTQRKHCEYCMEALKQGK